MCAISVYSTIDIVFNIMKLFSKTLTENGLSVRREKIEIKLVAQNISIPGVWEYFEFHCGILISDKWSDFKIKNGCMRPWSRAGFFANFSIEEIVRLTNSTIYTRLKKKYIRIRRW
jgi:hypothetical protein